MACSKFAAAKKLAEAAFTLDEAKANWPDEDQAGLLHLAELMHNTAERLAGSRKDEMHRMVEVRT